MAHPELHRNHYSQGRYLHRHDLSHKLALLCLKPINKTRRNRHVVLIQKKPEATKGAKNLIKLDRSTSGDFLIIDKLLYPLKMR
ncbi:hypothetical protein Bca4012_030136 [Brassica carinata]|uniref:Uncharacterized protein n=1 Tax=Brassica carinata TaxID=52824 RepID=A0A8X7RJ52_BRACI|nr:hypothetical protein Bca52824_048502 [Brassica carinata]